MALFPEFKDCPGRDDGHSRIDGQQITHIAGESKSLRKEGNDHPDPEQNVFLPVVFHFEHAPDHPDHGGDAQNGVYRTNAPFEVIFKDKREWPARPLNGVGHIYIAAADVRKLFK
ncbi:hypothetical protein SDC9_94980 [bioreactor metagenome]|uniref:Uncharacterized protein n=1 Tax=bioreactor metagenome TaxID=1076179 RepID=A0A645A5N7_9ZZZZ